MRLAACHGVDPEAWYPIGNDLGASARAICGTCDVATDCLSYAIVRNERHGIWAGHNFESRHERERLGRRIAAGERIVSVAAAVPPIVGNCRRCGSPMVTGRWRGRVPKPYKRLCSAGRCHGCDTAHRREAAAGVSL